MKQNVAEILLTEHIVQTAVDAQLAQDAVLFHSRTDYQRAELEGIFGPEKTSEIMRRLYITKNPI